MESPDPGGLTQGDPAPLQGTLDNTWVILVVTTGVGPGMLPSLPRCPGHAHIREQSSPDVHGAEEERPWPL